LKPLQLNQSAKEHTEAEFTRLGCVVSQAPRPNQFIVRTPSGKSYNVQVRSLRLGRYAFVTKKNFKIEPSQLLVFVRFEDEKAPEMFLIPSSVKGKPNPIFEDRRQSETHPSEPEWGLSLTAATMAKLRQENSFTKILSRL
jgi:hypothetical protein